uniref:hypothetical protein n=1 Tax=Bosea sp. (in: a-proteobacteria) TaxID=1871050 RepID=UPI003B3A1AB4
IKVLGLEFPDGPVKPKPEKDVARAEAGPKTASAAVDPAPQDAPSRRSPKGGVPKGGAPKGDAQKGGPDAAGGPTKASGRAVRTVPKVPLTKA